MKKKNKQKKQIIKSEEVFSNIFENDTMSLFKDMEDNEEMASAKKFYNFQCINLYAYIDYPVATQIVTEAQLNQPINHLINTPIELYESPYTALILSPKTGKRQLVAFAVDVETSVYDELDLTLDESIKKNHIKPEQVRQFADVVRQLKHYNSTNNKKSKPYISYKINNIRAIKQVFPLQNV